MILELKYIDRVIDKQNTFVRWRVVFALLILILGATIFLITYIVNSNNSENIIKLLSGIGSALILTVTAWPIKEIIDKTNSIKMFKSFKADLIQFENDKLIETDESKRIREYVWKAVEKLAVA